LRFQSISAGYLHTCAISIDGQTLCWGLNEFGQLGNGSQTDALQPVPVGGQYRFTEVSGGGLHTCAIGGEGETYCWGFNDFGQLGDGSTTASSLPQLIQSASFRQISAGGAHTC